MLEITNDSTHRFERDRLFKKGGQFNRDPISRVDNSVTVTKRGTACVTNVLGLAAFGDSSIETAKKEGDIKNVAYVDRTYDGFMIYLPLFQKGCTVVKGN